MVEILLISLTWETLLMLIIWQHCGLLMVLQFVGKLISLPTENREGSGLLSVPSWLEVVVWLQQGESQQELLTWLPVCLSYYLGFLDIYLAFWRYWSLRTVSRAKQTVNASDLVPKNV